MAARDEKNRKRSQSGSYYTYGNVAYELQPDYTPYRVREEEEERRREAARIAKEAERENKVSFAKMVGVAIVLFIGCIAFMGMHVMVDQAEVSLRREKSKLEDLKSANAILEAELTEPAGYGLHQAGGNRTAWHERTAALSGGLYQRTQAELYGAA